MFMRRGRRSRRADGTEHQRGRVAGRYDRIFYDKTRSCCVVLSLLLHVAEEVFAAVACGIATVVACVVGTAVNVIAVVVSFVVDA